jgi:hypothetical protein
LIAPAAMLVLDGPWVGRILHFIAQRQNGHNCCSLFVDGFCFIKQLDCANAASPFDTYVCIRCGAPRSQDNYPHCSVDDDAASKTQEHGHAVATEEPPSAPMKRGIFPCVVCGVATTHVRLNESVTTTRPMWSR